MKPICRRQFVVFFLFPSFVVDDVDVTSLKYKMLSRAIDQLNALRDLRTKKKLEMTYYAGRISLWYVIYCVI